MATLLRSSNPALNSNAFLDSASGSVFARDGSMTINGTINKTAFLLILVLVGAMYSWSKFTGPASMDAVFPLMIGGALGGFALAMITAFKVEWSPYTAPAYALLEGLFIGGISAFFEARYPGVVMQAVSLTFGIMGAMLLTYRSGLIRATEKFKLGVVSAMGGIALVYLVSIGMSFFGHPLGIVYGNSALGIAFSAIVVVVASLNLILDFDLIETGVAQGAPKRMEWYGAFAMVVGLVWLYLTLLRLLSKLNSRN